MLLIAVISACQSGGEEQAQPMDMSSEDPEIAQLSGRIMAEPGNARLYWLRGLKYREFNNKAALADLQKAYSMDSSQSDFALALAEQYFAMNETRPSLNVLSRYSKYNPPDEKVLWILAELALILRQYQLSVGALNQILRLNEYNARAYYLKGRNYRFLGDTSQSVSSYQTAIELNPDMERAHLELGTMMLHSGDDLGLRYLRNALSLNDSSYAARYALAKYYQDRGELAEAAEFYEELVVLNPQHGAALYGLATIWYGADSLEKALRLFDLVTKVEPVEPRGYMGKAYCAIALNRREEALSYLEQTINLNREFPNARHLADSVRTLLK